MSGAGGQGGSARAEESKPLDLPQLRAVIDRLPRSVFAGLLDVDGVLIDVNRAALDAIDARPEDVLGQPFETTPWWRFSEVSRRQLRAAIRDGRDGKRSRFEAAMQDRDGRVLLLDFSLEPLYGASGEVEYLVPAASDLTERRVAEQRIEYLATHDEITGLPNRHLLQARLAEAMEQAGADQVVIVLLIDLDRFNLINLSLGHGAGDTVLCEATHRLMDWAGDRGRVARVGGDEFAVLLDGDVDAAAAATAVAEVLGRAITVEGQEIHLTCSIGCARHTAAGNTDDGLLLKKASAALHGAKARGGNMAEVYRRGPDDRDPERLALESALHHAIERDELFLCYQPQVDLASGRIVGAEALMRWRRPGHGVVPPDRFIPIAEQTGRIVPMGAWALETALATTRGWLAGEPRLAQISVNISAREFLRPDFVRRVETMLHAADVAPQRLTLELTESMLMDDAEGAVRTLAALKALGVRLALDDFGTGYSSLSYLRRFPLDVIKIDRSFVRDIAVDASTAAIVDATIRMAHSLNLDVVAEGVETEAQLAELAARGCDQAQGYLFSAPVPAEDLAALLRSDPPWAVAPARSGPER
ncbi:putative bifunctional diguanylate cyclase/phosphodiesterase [Salinisphaera orenii]|uniref:cyclic-guanylate-specific phosphodiesterase n=1 Tax=Salinisphaera orenii YIM 95161 TaxID=1051139 RepID=A0A423PRD3_9GAMM|nr:GGDEF domain-containing phosphodiesterase [Salinisphaera halophila]ROO28175.1 signal peptide protein [Salinisphaera halophila YIM 95161]